MPRRRQQVRPLSRLRVRATARTERAARKAGVHLLRALRRNAGLRDHSLRDLERLGHPYSKRNYSPLHDPPWLVHRQSGRLSSAVEMETRVTRNKVSVTVGVDAHKAPHVRDVVYGNSRMVARDFIRETAEEEREAMAEIIQEELAKDD